MYKYMDCIFTISVVVFLVYTFTASIGNIFALFESIRKKYNLKDKSKYTLILNFGETEIVYYLSENEFENFIELYLEGYFEKKIILYNDLMIFRNSINLIEIIKNRTGEKIKFDDVIEEYSNKM